MKLDLVNIYTDYLHDVNQQKIDDRYKGREEWFHASGLDFVCVNTGLLTLI